MYIERLVLAASGQVESRILVENHSPAILKFRKGRVLSSLIRRNETVIHNTYYIMKKRIIINRLKHFFI